LSNDSDRNSAAHWLTPDEKRRLIIDRDARETDIESPPDLPTCARYSAGAGLHIAISEGIVETAERDVAWKRCRIVTADSALPQLRARFVAVINIENHSSTRTWPPIGVGPGDGDVSRGATRSETET
jgi:hypothetical protein